eukprot:CAMPEP_0176038690 /NCGR_PEP_ID=MMETSP0120_2-20121206/19176_1 /TAXON_ID=160619 /ORGANISM="Kryptoperidinium foliaceum, Strain CCMP 1326" /LENGTH=380 /DNA_ID=CAMNT_0017372085 /DNA_START=1 /DNA_END=1139 /DNA_ORIENTATION=+
MGERMLVSNPGMPPWSRTGQWYGWEHGPVSSKHYAHVTPQRGHWAWQKGWGPQGQQELWASDMFGFHPEADMHWAEKEGPEPRVGVAGIGENTWSQGVVAYGQNEPKWGEKHESDHDWLSSGGHRRLGEADEAYIVPLVVTPRPVVPMPVQWPAAFEPDHVVCGADGGVVALTSSGIGAVVPMGATAGAAATTMELEGLLELGLARGASLTRSGLLVLTSSGRLASCPLAEGAPRVACSALATPPLPGLVAAARASAAVELHEGRSFHAAIAFPGGRIEVFHFDTQEAAEPAWRKTGVVHLPEHVVEAQREVVAVSTGKDHLLVTADDGSTFRWKLLAGAPRRGHPIHDAPVKHQGREWQSACALPGGKILRLASTWRKA